MSPRGGKRQGAGRPRQRKTAMVALTMRLEPEVMRAFNREKKARKLSGPKLLAELLDPKTRAARRNARRPRKALEAAEEALRILRVHCPHKSDDQKAVDATAEKCRAALEALTPKEP